MSEERAAGIRTRIGNHTFRTTGITGYLKNGGTLEKAAMIANHASTRATQLYARRSDEISLDEVERILIEPLHPHLSFASRNVPHRQDLWERSAVSVALVARSEAD